MKPIIKTPYHFLLAFALLAGFLVAFQASQQSVHAQAAPDHALQSATQTPTPKPRRATHTPEPLPGEATPTPDVVETEGNGMTGYYISFGLLVALMILNRVLAIRDKRNRPSRK